MSVALYEHIVSVSAACLNFSSHTGGNDNLSVLLNRSQMIVKREKISDVVGSDSCKINNQLDNKYEPQPGPDIVKKALEMVGQELPFSMSNGNCEHFAMWLRYGEGLSQEVGRLHLLSLYWV